MCCTAHTWSWCKMEHSGLRKTSFKFIWIAKKSPKQELKLNQNTLCFRESLSQQQHTKKVASKIGQVVKNAGWLD